VLKGLRGANLFAMIFDLVGAIILALYALIVGPLGVLRGPIAFERSIWYLWVLLPQGLMARSIRAAIDWRLGNFDSAIAQLEGLVGANEEYYKDRPSSRARRRVLEDFYTVLARAYLHAGHIDDAMLVVIRAKKSMAIDRLGGLAELDAKTAHLVRAGLAAGRLLDGGGLATMFVRSNQQESDNRRPRIERQGASRDGDAKYGKPQGDKPVVRKRPAATTVDANAPAKQRAGEGAKIIPFPPASASEESPS
jgi:hypothetical protein